MTALHEPLGANGHARPTQDELEVFHPASWRQMVLARVRRIRAELAWVENAEDRVPVEELLDTAEEAACTKASMADAWEGTLIERAWTATHDAEACLVERLDDKRAREWGKAFADVKEERSTDPYAVAQEIRKRYDESDKAYEEERSFRNRLVRLTAIGGGLTVLLVAAGMTGAWRIGEPGKAAVASGTSDVLLIALFGAIGAFITGMPSLSRAPSRRTPFRLGLYQLALKLAVGPMFAVVGLLLANSGVVTQTRPFTTLSEVLVWAAVFGGVQQTVTRVLDRKAGGFVGAVSEEETAAKQATGGTPGS